MLPASVLLQESSSLTDSIENASFTTYPIGCTTKVYNSAKRPLEGFRSVEQTVVSGLTHQKTISSEAQTVQVPISPGGSNVESD